MKAKENNIQNELLDESRGTYSIIYKLAWPVVLEQLFITLISYADTAMVGTLGTDASASIGLVAPFTWMINGLMTAIGVGFSVMVGRAYGAGQFDYAKRIVRQGIVAAVLVGGAITLLVECLAPFIPIWMNADPLIRSNATNYFAIYGSACIFSLFNSMGAAILRCSGDTKTPFYLNVSANILNVSLNFLLIYPTRVLTVFGISFTMPGADMGVSGAALASAISLTVIGSIMLSRLYLKKYPIRISLKGSYKPEKKIIKNVVRLATPVALERITQNFGQIVMTALVTGVGTAALAAHNFAITAEGLTYMPAFGFGAAATTLVAQSLGAGKRELASKYADACVKIGIIFMSAMGILLFLLSYQLIDIFSNDPQVIDLGGYVLRIEAFAQPFFAMQMVSSGALRGAGDTKYPFIYSLIGMWAVRVVTAVVLVKVFDMQLVGAWIAMVANITVSGILIFTRLRRRKWLDSWKIQDEAK